MTDNSLEEVLDGTVDEVKDSIRDSEDLDLEKLLKLEEEGDDRKTLKEFMQRHIDEDGGEDEEFEEVEEIEEETSGGLLGSYSKSSVLAGGALIGIFIGLVIGMSAAPGGANAAPPQQVADSVGELISAGGFNGTVDVSDPERQHGMYYMNVSVTQEAGNETVTQSQGVYTTLDGSLLFPVISQFGQQQSPIDLEASLQDSQETNSTQ